MGYGLDCPVTEVILPSFVELGCVLEGGLQFCSCKRTPLLTSWSAQMYSSAGNFNNVYVGLSVHVGVQVVMCVKLENLNTPFMRPVSKVCKQPFPEKLWHLCRYTNAHALQDIKYIINNKQGASCFASKTTPKPTLLAFSTG